MKGRIRLGLVGVGKIARDQHLPALSADHSFDLAATASLAGRIDGVPGYARIEEMIADGQHLDAVSICTPPAGRYAIARAAIEAGLHVMLEKPPAATPSEIEALSDLAARCGVTLFTTWHSREAAGVAPAREWLSDKNIRGARIIWKEDIRRWHPGQDWIMEAGGFGVFDPGINALSIATAILPAPLLVESALMDVPEGRGSPIAATMTMRSGQALVTAELDFLQTGPQSWDLEVDTDAGTLRLSDGGDTIQLPGSGPVRGRDQEYALLYARFAHLIAAGASDVDIRPLQLVADAFLVARRRSVAPFEF